MKHIESIQPELAAHELTRMLLSDATATAALTALLHNVTGCDIPPTADTPQSEVEELVPLCASILRRHWQTPLTAFGDGNTPMSLADLLRQTIGDRVQGNEAWSIPPANADIPTALTALLDRKISGIPQAPDGISLAQLIGNADITTTKLVDTNKGYIWNRERFNTNSLLFTMMFPHLEEAYLGCKSNTQAIIGQNSTIKKIVFEEMEEIGVAPFWITSYDGGFESLTEISFPKLKIGRSLVYWDLSGWWNKSLLGLTTLNLPELETIDPGNAIGGAFISGTMPRLEVLSMPKLKSLNTYLYGGSTLSGLRELRMPNLTHMAALSNTYLATTDGLPNLILLEVGEMQSSMDVRYWQPSADILALPEFLSNFKTYIANRLTDNGSGLTLTLSQAVRDAIQQDPEIVSIITSKGWTISPAPSV